jgi:hypothetical protein
MGIHTTNIFEQFKGIRLDPKLLRKMSRGCEECTNRELECSPYCINHQISHEQIQELIRDNIKIMTVSDMSEFITGNRFQEFKLAGEPLNVLLNTLGCRTKTS